MASADALFSWIFWHNVVCYFAAPSIADKHSFCLFLLFFYSCHHLAENFATCALPFRNKSFQLYNRKLSQSHLYCISCGTHRWVVINDWEKNCWIFIDMAVVARDFASLRFVVSDFWHLIHVLKISWNITLWIRMCSLNFRTIRLLLVNL